MNELINYVRSVRPYDDDVVRTLAEACQAADIRSAITSRYITNAWFPSLRKESVTHRTASGFRSTKTSRKKSLTRACGSQRRAADIRQVGLIITMLYFSASPQMPAGGVPAELRCVASRYRILAVTMENIIRDCHQRALDVR